MAQRFAELGVKVEYEPDKIKYVIPQSDHIYTPDWKLPDGSYVETKGKWTQKDRAKMVLLKKQFPDVTFRLLFQRGSNTISRTSKTTYMDWCTKHGLEAADYQKEGIPERWYKV